MSNMIAYTTALLEVLASWLGSEPIIYLFGLCCGCFVIKMIKSMMTL